MIRDWLDLIWVYLLQFWRSSAGRSIESGNGKKYLLAAVVATYFVGDRILVKIRSSNTSTQENTAKITALSGEENTETTITPIKFSNMSSNKMQVAVPENTSLVSANREEESELEETTTLSEVRKKLDGGHMHEKTAKYEAQENTSLVEDHRTKSTESSKMALQQESTTVVGNTKVFSSKVETSESFSMEESEEYEIEG